MEEAIARAKDVNSRGMHAILNFLGEHHRDRGQVRKAVDEYDRLIRRVEAEALDASVSVKLTQVGLGISEEVCVEHMEALAAAASDRGVFLWIDMESSAYTEGTLRVYRRLLETRDRVGVCLQANLRRTAQDLPALAEQGGIIRLVKGAYREPADRAFTRKDAVDESYERLLRQLFDTAKEFAVATHDDRFVAQAERLAETHSRNFEFQMLLGVRDPLKDELCRKGYRVSEYIPYGSRWLAYFSRRLSERPGNLLTAFRSLLDVRG